MEIALKAVLLVFAFQATSNAATLIWTGSGGNGNWFTPANWSSNTIPGTLDDVTIDANVTVAAASLPISFNTLTLGGTNSPTLKLSTGTANAGALIINNKAVFEQNSSLPVTFSSIIVNAGGKLTHTANSTSRQYGINLLISGDFELQSGATIYLDGLGYAAEYGPGKGQSSTGSGSNGSGAGHGGNGGNGNLSGGIAYDVLTDPADLGSGGGAGSRSSAGGAGGGLLHLVVGGMAQIDGLITANGSTPSYDSYYYGGGGGGSGGTINVSAGNISGAGAIMANGSISPYGGGGGGGMVAVKAALGNNYSGILSAAAGTGSQNGGVGFIAKRTGEPLKYSLSVDGSVIQPGVNTVIPAGIANISELNVFRGNIAGSTFSVDSLTISANTNLSITKVTAANLYITTGAAVVVDGVVEVTGNAALPSGATLTISTMNVLGSLSLLTGSKLQHRGNSTSKAYGLDLTIGGNFNLQSGATIYLDGLGCPV